MTEIQDIELVNKFVEDSLTSEEMDLFNQKYQTDSSFAELANDFLDISIAVKAADKFGRIVAKRELDSKTINTTNNKWIFSLAASLSIIIVISGFAFYLFKKNNELARNNTILSEKLAITQNKMKELKGQELPDMNTQKNVGKSNIVKGSSINDSEYLSGILALNKVIASINEVNEMSYTRNVDVVRTTFPSKSNLIDNNDAFISLSKIKPDTPLNYALIESSTEDTIYRLEEYKIDQIPLNKIRIEEGKNYHWILEFKKKEVASGDFYVLTSEERKQVKKFTFHSAQDYIEAFTYYYNNGYLFDAQLILKKGIDTYPDAELFGYLKQLLLNEQ